MANSEAKLKSNGDKSSTYFKPFYRKHVTSSCLPGFCYRFHSDTILLALPISWGYRTKLISGLPTQTCHSKSRQCRHDT